MKKTRSIRTILISIFTSLFFVFTFVIGVTSYVLYSQNIIRVNNKQFKNANTQTVTIFENYFSDLINISSNIQKKSANIDLQSEEVAFRYFLDDLMEYKKSLTGIAIYDTNDGSIVTHTTKYNKETSVLGSPWFVNSVENPLIHVFSPINTISDEDVFTISKKFSYDKENKSAILKIDCSFSEMNELIDSMDFGKDGHISIYNNENYLIYSSGDYEIDEKKVVSNLIFGEQIAKIGNNKFHLYLTTISNTGWKIGIFNNYTEITNVLNTFLGIVIGTAILVFALFVFLIILISNHITNPIRQLQKEMAKVESLNYDPTLIKDIEGSKEVENLSMSFNTMMLKIDELARRLLEEEKTKRVYELRALQNQINPHFLYNTLDSIVYLIDSKENEKASEMIIALSKFFRISISKGKNIIPISMEIEHVKNYLLIQKIRFGDNFSFDIKADENILNYKTVKLILQPIVENSIIHGLQEIENHGHIEVKGYEKNGLIHFEIIDNGFGILPEKVEEIYQSFKSSVRQKSVGICNVYQRLKLYYGEGANIIIHSDLDEGTNIEIIFPIKGENENE